jgi:hypothetical protein
MTYRSYVEPQTALRKPIACLGGPRFARPTLRMRDSFYTQT